METFKIEEIDSDGITKIAKNNRILRVEKMLRSYHKSRKTIDLILTDLNEFGFIGYKNPVNNMAYEVKIQLS